LGGQLLLLQPLQAVGPPLHFHVALFAVACKKQASSDRLKKHITMMMYIK
jgi:hypothetical protein